MNKETFLLSIAIFMTGVLCGSLMSRTIFDSDSPVLTKTVHSVPEGMRLAPDGELIPDTDQVPNAHSDHGDMLVGSEQEFIIGMIPHHQEAVDTAKEVLARGAVTPEVRALAENIVSLQEREIADMKKWYEAWYGESYRDTGVYAPMMRDFTGLSGADLDKAFLEDMIMHHMGAIMMAESVTSLISHPEVTALTQSIKETQTREIETMRQLLEAF